MFRPGKSPMITPPASSLPPDVRARPSGPSREAATAAGCTASATQTGRTAQQVSTAQQQHAQASPTSSLASTQAAPVSIAQVLPAELLHLIFTQLALSTHSQCALVCRHWYASLPFTRVRIGRWLKSRENREWQGRVCRDWAQAYSTRAYPFLAGHGCELVPLLQHQHQEWQQCRDRQRKAPSRVAERSVQTAHHMLSALVRYALHQQIIQAPKLRLWPAVIHWQHSDFLSLFSFSPCGRWLAACRQAHSGAPRFLRFHAWQPDGWHKDKTIPRLDLYVEDILCSYALPATFYSNHGATISVWQREPDTGWRRTWQHRTHVLHEIDSLNEASTGDLVTLSRRSSGEPGWMLDFYCYRDHDRSWASPASFFYGLEPRCLVTSRTDCHLALAVSSSVGRDHRKNEIHFWHRVRQAGQVAWTCHPHPLRPDQAQVTALDFTQSCRHLLTLLGDGQICIWHPGSHNRWQQRLTVATAIDVTRQVLADVCSSVSREDTIQLVVPGAARQLQFWHEDGQGNWTQGARIDTPPEPGMAAGELVREVLLASNGRLLVQRTRWCLDIWHQDHAKTWQRLIHHRSETGTAPRACLLGIGREAVCTTSGDTAGNLWIHGLNAEGKMVEKARVAAGAPIRTLFCSEDGLTLVPDILTEQIPTLLHLGPPTQQNAARQDLHIQDLLP